MDFIPVAPVKKALNKAYLRRPIERAELLRFAEALHRLFDDLDETESEEHCKNLFAEFLKESFYRDRNTINTRGKVDLAIYAGTKGGDKPQVLFEVKRPANFQEMFSDGNQNSKALHELILYHLRERFEGNNLELKHLAISNVRELYLFDARDFEAAFAKNRALVQAFKDSERGAGLALGAGDFYSEIAKPFILNTEGSIWYVHLSLIELDRASRSPGFDLADLILPYKLLSPAHLLKEPFQNDSNSLDKAFYSELLHLMGLEEHKEGSKLVIRRPDPPSRIPGSLIELGAEKLELSRGIDRLNESELFGASVEEATFAVVLELVLLWVNRLLFMKLLEAQILEHRSGDDSYRFLTKDALPDFEALHELFFGVLAKKPVERGERLQNRFGKVPYLNSSLFEESELENILPVDRLNSHVPLRIHGRTVLKDVSGERLSGEMPVLDYILAFLDAYDFSAEGEGAAVERGKTLISASVLGLIFEKINGYKEGSFYTPGYVTQYMAKKTVESIVLFKFSQALGKEYADMSSLSNDLGTSSAEILEANAIFDSLRIVDPAVGSGHFLVSVLNELVASKSELGILADRSGKRLKDVHVVIENDELFLVDEESASFATYRAPFTKNERQRLRETLFEEKRRLIENCLFGVDLNRNSVQICKLRLWIELLKSSYYTEDSGYTELETLPNIDVNIKRGNSLVARYSLDMDLAAPLKKKGWNIAHWMNAVRAYQNAKTRHEKQEAESVMAKIREALAGAAYNAMPDRLKLIPLKGELAHLEAPDLIARAEKDTKAEARIVRLRDQIRVIEERLASDDANPIFREAFEWRYTFPEVLDEKGAFVGFDAVIGNPPYIRQEELGEYKPHFENRYKTFEGTADIYSYFFELSLNILRKGGIFRFIVSNSFFKANYGKGLRKYLCETGYLRSIIDFGGKAVFESAKDTYVCIPAFEKSENGRAISICKADRFDEAFDLASFVDTNSYAIERGRLGEAAWSFDNEASAALLAKLMAAGIGLGKYLKGAIYYGIKTGLNEAFVIEEARAKSLMSLDSRNKSIIRPVIGGEEIRRWQLRQKRQFIIFARRGIDISLYPGIASHLEKWKNNLRPKKDKKEAHGRKPGRYAWYEIQDDVAYYEVFDSPKIIFPDICKDPRFYLDTEGHYLTNTAYAIGSSELYLLGILNSKLFWFLIGKISIPFGTRAGEYRYRLIYQYMEQVPIVERKEAEADPARSWLPARIESLVFAILEKKKIDPAADVAPLETEIDGLVYSLYGLTEEEIGIVEGKRA